MHWKEKYYQDLEAYETKTQLLRQKREIQLKELQHTVALVRDFRIVELKVVENERIYRLPPRQKRIMYCL